MVWHGLMVEHALVQLTSEETLSIAACCHVMPATEFLNLNHCIQQGGSASPRTRKLRWFCRKYQQAGVQIFACSSFCLLTTSDGSHLQLVYVDEEHFRSVVILEERRGTVQERYQTPQSIRVMRTTLLL